MAKKQYLSPQLNLNVFENYDVLTYSGDAVFEEDDSSVVGVVGPFDNGWLK